ncbi:serine hydrolase [candidate division KSB1 bacterium]|nr:serine hydrolase [candidate division KSB1 bacterium]
MPIQIKPLQKQKKFPPRNAESTEIRRKNFFGDTRWFRRSSADTLFSVWLRSVRIGGKQRILLPLLFILFFSSTSSFAQYEYGESIVAGKLGAKLDQYMTRLARFGFSGALLVAQKGKIILHKGYGWANRARGIPITNETVFDVASLTKQFTAAAILKLEMRNRLKTSDRLSKFLSNVPKDKVRVTLHHLLTHTSGLPAELAQESNYSRERFLSAVLHAPLKTNPGQKYSYSNLGYTLLAAVIESVSGQSYEAFLAEELFQPAGMLNTGFYLDSCKWAPALVAHGYNESIDNGPPHWRQPDYQFRGAYYVLTSVGDLYKWETALRNNTVLSEGAKRNLFTAQASTDDRGVDYGYGWKIETTDRRTALVSHGGVHSDGFNSLFQRYPDEDVVVIAVANKIFGGFLPMTSLQHELPAIIFDRQYALPPDEVEIDSTILKKYAGVYELPSGAKLKVAAENGGLKIAAEGQEAIDLLVSARYRQRRSPTEYDTRIAAILDKAGQGDFSPFVMKQCGRMSADAIKAFFSKLWMQLEEGYGALQSFEILGTVPAVWAPTTYVRLNFERWSAIYRFQWKDGAFTFMPGSLSLLYTRFAPQSATEFVGFHPGIGKLIRASFALNNDGEVIGLTMQDDEKTVYARRKYNIIESLPPIVVQDGNWQTHFGFEEAISQ